jgi:hypothetical protein
MISEQGPIMKEQQITKEMIIFNKSILDKTMNKFVDAHDYLEKMFATFMENANWISEDAKKAIHGWISAYKKGYDDFKTITDKKFENVLTHFTDGAGERKEND